MTFEEWAKKGAFMDRLMWMVVLTCAIVVGANIATLMEDAARQSTVPVAVESNADTVFVVRTILVGPPRPDTTLRYECKEAK